VWCCCGFPHVRAGPLCLVIGMPSPASDLWARFVTQSRLGLIRRAVEVGSASELPPRCLIEVEAVGHSPSAGTLMMAPCPASVSSTGSS
jgi:hypothetical protein